MSKFRDRAAGGIAASMGGRDETQAVAGDVGLAAKMEGRRGDRSAAVIRLDRIEPDPDQPRVEFEPAELGRLAESLKARGQLQPIRVRWHEAEGSGSARYRIVVGERRYRAALLAGLETIACVVVDGGASPEDLLEDQLVENALRLDLRPVEQARAYRRLIDARGLTQGELARRLHLADATVSRALALLELPETIQGRVDAGQIAPETAYEIGRIPDPAEQAQLADLAAAGALRRDEAKAIARAASQRKSQGKAMKAKAKAKLPRELKYRGSGGVRFAASLTARHTLADVAAGLREWLDQLDAQAQAHAA